MSLARIYGGITKIEERPDGTLYVEGVASSEARDSQGEIVRAAAMRDALPDYLKFPAVREMHQPIAAGKAVGAEVRDDGRTYIAAIVVDPGSVSKVKAGVLKGFSIGGSVVRRAEGDATVIEALKLSEISLVDRPANPEAAVTLVKLEDAPASEPAAPAPTLTPGETVIPAALAKKLAAVDSGATAAPAVTITDAGDMTAVLAKLAPALARARLEKFLGEEIWDAKAALEALQIIQGLIFTETHEEGEDPAQMADLRTAFDRLKAFIAAEIAENNEPAATPSAPSAIAAAQSVADLTKALRDQLVELAQQAAEVAKATVTPPATDGESLAKVDALEKRATEAEAAASQAGEALAKVLAEREALTKSRDELTAQVTELTTKLAAKGVVRVVEKGQDLGALGKSADEPEPTDIHGQIKKAQRAPIPLAFR